MSFREGNNRQIELPKAGHFKKKSTLPNVDDKSFNDSVTLETARQSCALNLLVLDSEDLYSVDQEIRPSHDLNESYDEK